MSTCRHSKLVMLVVRKPVAKDSRAMVAKCPSNSANNHSTCSRVNQRHNQRQVASVLSVYLRDVGEVVPLFKKVACHLLCCRSRP